MAQRADACKSGAKRGGGSGLLPGDFLFWVRNFRRRRRREIWNRLALADRLEFVGCRHRGRDCERFFGRRVQDGLQLGRHFGHRGRELFHGGFLDDRFFHGGML